MKLIFILFRLYSSMEMDCFNNLNILLNSPKKQISETEIRLGNTIIANGNKYTIIKEIGRGKSGYSYLATSETAKVVIKQIHYEPLPYPYPKFEGDKLENEIVAYQALSKLDIPMPKLLYYDPLKQFLIKEYIEGETLAEVVANGQFGLDHLMQMFDICEKIYPHLNIDFFPLNFVVQNDTIYYIDYEIGPYSEKHHFKNWGIYYYANTIGMKALLEDHDSSLMLNNHGPIKIGLDYIVEGWLRFSNFQSDDEWDTW